MRHVVVLVVLLGHAVGFFFATHSVYRPPLADSWPSHCQAPTALYLVSRHGVREPGDKVIQAAAELERWLHSSSGNRSVASSLPWLSDWSDPFRDPKGLTHVGIDELEQMGRRMRSRFGQLHQMIPLHAVSVRSTHVSRTARSALAFVRGFLGPDVLPFVEMTDEANDWLLRPFDLCLDYLNSVVRNPKVTLLEHEKFARSHFPMLDERFQLLGFPAKLGRAHSLWNLACFETALFNQSGHFASLFSDPETMAVMNYYEDLKYYYERGYGAEPYAHLLASSLLQDAVDFFTQSSASSAIKFRFLFAHAETMMPLYVKLGLFQDSNPLLAKDFSPLKRWKWETGRIAPFQANLAMYQARCGKDMQPSVVMQVNEETVAVEPQDVLMERFNLLARESCETRQDGWGPLVILVLVQSIVIGALILIMACILFRQARRGMMIQTPGVAFDLLSESNNDNK